MKHHCVLTLVCAFGIAAIAAGRTADGFDVQTPAAASACWSRITASIC